LLPERMSIDVGDFKRGMRHLIASVTLITTYHRGLRGGLTATAVCSVSADPPQLLACVNRSASAHDSIGEAGVFCVNVLAPEHQEIARRFAGMDGIEGDDRFIDMGEWTRLVTGAPVLMGCPVNFDCEVVQTMPAGTHTVYLGRIVGVRHDEQAGPLCYVDARFVPGSFLLRPLA
jgi:flavin reductase (DIM6/NTAB) family NADH-FMN oxidoreductase RutF